MKCKMSPSFKLDKRINKLSLLRHALILLQISLLWFFFEFYYYGQIFLCILLFISSQARYYTLSSSPLLFHLSFLLDLGLIQLNDFNSPWFNLALYLPLLFDLYLLKFPKTSRRLLFILTLFLMCIHHPLSLDTAFLYMIACLLIFLLILSIIRDQRDLSRELSDKENALSSALIEAEEAKNLLMNSQQNREELAILRERNLISREIHDSVGHSLSTIIIQLSAMEKIAISQPEQCSQMAKVLADFSRESLDRIRLALRELKPQRYSAYELVLLLDNLVRESEELVGIRIALDYTGQVKEIDDPLVKLALAVTREFIANSQRHGKPELINLHLHFREDIVIYNLKDDGKGCKPDVKLGLGLNSMAERAKECGGQFSWTSSPGKGFSARFVLPLRSKQQAITPPDPEKLVAQQEADLQQAQELEKRAR